MSAHREILKSLGAAIAESQTVLEFCRENFGRGLAVQVGAYAQCFPGEKDSPFLWITPNDENEATKEDDLFAVRCVVGGLVKGPSGEKVINNVIIERAEDTNGLVVNGGNEIVEELRDIIIEVARNASTGAIVNRIRREESDISHFPLEWASFYIEYADFEGLSEVLG